MLERLSDEHIATLLRVAKTNKGLRAFFGHPKGMISLREEAHSRGIYATKSEADLIIKRVCNAMED